MPDDLDKREPQDRRTINLNEDWEVEYWSKKFNVTAEKLRAAVNAHGNSATEVRKQLKDASKKYVAGNRFTPSSCTTSATNDDDFEPTGEETSEQGECQLRQAEHDYGDGEQDWDEDHRRRCPMNVTMGRRNKPR